MKVATKPISSPGRTDEFPPPLMIFPRSKSKRGSRSRANPMFFRKINTRSNDPIQEPSSPKVTCIGQVRVSRSQPTTTTATTNTAFRRCRWIQKLKSTWFQRAWSTNLSFFRCECCKKSPELKRIEVNQEIEYRKREIEDVNGRDNVNLIPESTPRNAFLLTRSRSAPFRSSSLASKFLESAMEQTGVDMEDDETGEEVKKGEGVNGINNEEDESLFNGDEEFRAEPLNLSRCKSEPARIGDKLFTSFSS